MFRKIFHFGSKYFFKNKLTKNWTQKLNKKLETFSFTEKKL